MGFMSEKISFRTSKNSTSKRILWDILYIKILGIKKSVSEMNILLDKLNSILDTKIKMI